jgi:uncharacterized protein (TIGR02246 family)
MTPAGKGSSRDKEAIHSQIDVFVTAWNNHDPRAMSMVYDEDADLVNPFGRSAKSRTEIEALLKDEHTGPVRDSCISLMFEGLRLLTSDVAVSDHSFEMSGVRDRSGAKTTLRGHLTMVFRKHRETWRIVACRPMIPAHNPEGPPDATIGGARAHRGK